ncbi:hypothetical protein D9M71_571320 [compost metagenome]
MVDFHTGEVQSLSLPIADHLADLRRDFFLIQRLELPIQANHRNHRPAVVLEQLRIHSGSAPARLGKGLQGQHPQRRKVCTAVPEGGVVGRRPLPLPDVELLIQRRCVRSFATGGQRQRYQQDNGANEKTHGNACS